MNNLSADSSAAPSFGRWLKRLRAQRDLTQEALAELAYCSVQTIRFFESGKRRPSLDMAERLAEVLEVPTDQQAQFVKAARTALNSEDERAQQSVPAPSAVEVAAAEVPAPDAATPGAASSAARLPLPATLLVGRQPEAAQLQRLLVDEGQRLVTLVGPGGIGKTRLALHMAHMLDAYFANGALFVPLVSVSNSMELPAAIAGALGKNLSGDSSTTAQLDALLAGRQALLVLDNFEHLLAMDGSVNRDEAIIDLIEHILQHIPTVTMLITSRERLRVAGEHIFELGGLAMPALDPTSDASGDTVSQEAITSDAVMLFLQRARQVAPAFALTRANRAAIVRLCTLLRGMPLGIELAAAWMRMLTPEEIATEIGRSLDFLTLADRGVPARHRSLRAAFEHSWKLLSPAEQKAAAHLAIFRGGFTREAAQVVAGASLPTLAALIDKSLVQVQAEAVTPMTHAPAAQIQSVQGQSMQSTGALRYDIHELLRQYLREKLIEMGDDPVVARRHLEYFLRMAEEVASHHYATVPHALFKRLRTEQGNLRAAMEWALRDEHAPQEGLRLVGALGRYWYMGDAWQEGREWLGLALTHVNASTPLAVCATILTQLGDMEHAMADYAIAKTHVAEAIDIWRELDDDRQLAWALFQMGVLHSTIAEFADAEVCFEECLATYRKLDDPWFIALVLMQLASTKISDNDFVRAIELLDEALPIFRNQERTNIMAVALNMQGWGYVQRGDHQAAIENFKEALAIGQLEGNYQSMGWSHRNLGMAYRLVHELDEAERNIRAALHLYQQISFKSGMVIAFEILASIAAEQGKAETGVRWLGVAGTLRQAIGLPRTPSDERLYYNVAYELTTATLDPAAWQAAHAAGSKLTLDEALALAQHC